MRAKARVGRLLVIGWDGADPDLVESLCARGRLPNLQSLKARGLGGRLASTFPPSSLPAWTSALTGLEPGKHGLVNYVRRDPACYRLRLTNARERSAITLQVSAARAGMQVASLGVPGSYPPEPNAGLCIAGFDTPFAMRACRQAHEPPGVFDMLKSRGLSWPYGDMDETAVRPGWHHKARDAMLNTIQEKLRIAEVILQQEDPFDLFFMVFSESDTAAHHFWAFHDKQSPRYRKNPVLADTLEEIYCALDGCLGVLLGYLDEKATVVVLSDHGFGGASDTVFCINRWLALQGYLSFDPHLPLGSRLAGWLRDIGSRWLPPSIKQNVLRGPFSGLVMKTDALCRFGGLDLQRTRAFSDELPQNPGIWINLRGRDPLGLVEPGDEYERFRQQIIDQLQAFRTTNTSQPVVSRVFRREEVVPGPFMDRAPDLLVELASWGGYRVLSEQSGGRSGPILRKLSQPEKIGSKGIGVSGVHRPEGILFAAGPCVDSTAGSISRKIEDVFPTMLSLLGLEVPPVLDGRVIEEIAPVSLSTNRLEQTAGIPDPGLSTVPSEEEAVLRKRLENLGYL